MRAGAKSVELYFERENYADYAHFSLHQSGDWHLKVNGPVAAEWRRPKKLNLARALSVAQTAAVAVVDDPANPDDNAQLVAMADDAEALDAAIFDVWIEARGAADHGGWPGKDQGTTFVGRVPLADGGAACVVARQRKMDLTSLDPPQPGPELDAVRAVAGDEPFPITAVTHDNDGTILLVDHWMVFEDADEAGAATRP